MASSPVELLRSAAEDAPDLPALRCGNFEITYRDYARAAAALAEKLVALQSDPRSPIVICLPNSIEIALFIFAAQATGAAVCTLNPGYTRRELKIVLDDAQPGVIVCAHEKAADIEAISPPSQSRPHLWALERGELDGRAFVAELLAEWERSRPELPIPSAETIGALLYTGGTSGRPKGVLLKNGAIAANVEQRERMLPTEKDSERILCVMPLFHTFAISMCLHLAARCRGLLVIMPRYRPDWVLEALENHRITRLPAGPTVFNGLLGFDGVDRFDFSHLKCAYSGSAPLPKSTLNAWAELTGAALYEGYGQTEAGPILSYNSPAAPIRAGSVGKAAPHTQIEIVDALDPDRILPVGQIGEIRARGPQIMSGYLNAPDATAEALRGGWLYTGDLGRLDEEGYLFIEDRKKDMAIVGGYNVYPREIDEVLSAHPAVAEAAVVGVSDAYRGEILAAHVVLRAGSDASEEDLRAHCQEQLVKYKVPAVLRILEDLPRTSVGKIDKKELRARAEGSRS